MSGDRSVVVRLLLIIGLAVLLFPGAIQAQPAADANATYCTNLELGTFGLINDYRKNHHLPELKWNASIAQVARGHSVDMASGRVDFGHGGFNGRVKTLQVTLVGLVGAGENVLMTDDPNTVAMRAVDIWLHSPHHLKNIRGDFNYSGMGVWRNEQGVIYFTQVFVKLAPRALPVQATPEPQVVTPFNFVAPPNTR